MGGFIKKGQKGCPVIFWNWSEKKDKETGEIEKSAFARYYTVFNFDQTEGIELDVSQYLKTNSNPEKLESCEQIVAGYVNKPEIVFRSAASYHPAEDKIQMPRLESFRSSEDYYSALFHEMVHSTGHVQRLKRSTLSTTPHFGDEIYSKEELVAEIGASFLCGEAGVLNQTLTNSAAYIQGWLKALKSDKRLTLQASAQAQRAFDYILGRSGDESD